MMIKGAINKHFHFWQLATARTLLFWVAFQSLSAVAMPMITSHDCCPNDLNSSHEHHQQGHKMAMQQDLVHSDNSVIDHSECEQCTFNCQLIAAISISPQHRFDLVQYSNHQLFFLPSSSLSLPFRPPIS